MSLATEWQRTWDELIAAEAMVVEKRIAERRKRMELRVFLKKVDVPGISVSQREKQILEMVVSGTANKVIAIDLGISERTVKFHVSNLLAKAGVESRTELTMELFNEKTDISSDAPSYHDAVIGPTQCRTDLAGTQRDYLRRKLQYQKEHDGGRTV